VATISFARGVPAPECLPVEELADCARVAIARGGPEILSYGPAGGYAPLRAWIADRHGVEPERVVLTNGSLQGFVFLAERLAPGKRVLVEAPTYDRPLRILARVGAEPVALRIDDEGLDPERLDHALRAGPPPAFLYTIPTFQNPSGRTLPLERRRRVLELARAHGVLVVEDDPYGFVSFEGEPPPTLHRLAGGEGVVHSSSFSKTVAPGVRVGWFVLPRELAADLEARAVSTYISPPFFAQATVFEFLRRGNFEPNLERVRGLLRARRDAMLAALEQHLGGGRCKGWSRPAGGYFVWLELAEDVDAADVLERAEAEGVTFVKGADFFPGGAGGRSSARLAFSYVSPDEIEEGVRRLSAAVGAAAPASVAVGATRSA
jgi:DNA-binding transcriptional MocR family regulator